MVRSSLSSSSSDIEQTPEASPAAMTDLQGSPAPTIEEVEHAKENLTRQQASWWRVMCLTGVDYFSTLGYQPGIAFLAAGILSPVATGILVLMTLFGALPVYWIVAKESPHGQGSISMLERLFPGWRGKTVVLVLLGFAATDFVITITLSAADATAHLIENPVLQSLHVIPHNPIIITIGLLSLLAGIFMLGFRKAIGFSTILVTAYLAMTSIVLYTAVQHLVANPNLFTNWQSQLSSAFDNPVAMVAAAALLFPKLALGLSGFETGVSVMPLIKAKNDDDEHRQRVANTRKLLVTVAVIMSIALMVSSVCTTVLIPAGEFAQGGQANGRAISYLAHNYLGPVMGTAYDAITIAILWFAGASAMAGLLTLVPRYLPRYGMAPEWTSATRPLVTFFAVVTIAVTIIFKASVDAQAAAYATGVLVLITSAAIAVTTDLWIKKKIICVGAAMLSVILVYTTAVNMILRPDGLQIACFFIGSIVAISMMSRTVRSFELRVKKVELDATAMAFMADARERGAVRIIAHRPGGSAYESKAEELQDAHGLDDPEHHVIFLEVSAQDPSQFENEVLTVQGVEIDGGYKILRCQSPAVPNAIAALLLHIRNITGITPHVYFGWTEGSPFFYVFKFIFFGEGETAPLTREILRTVEKRLPERPVVHVG
ncbi:MAG: amino acid transporter [Cyanobacteria bacterium REEB67]|nr:amino acid transporter [Cyanobacteria bacterium REEB67]